MEALEGVLAEANERLRREETKNGMFEEDLNERRRFEKLPFDLSVRLLSVGPEEIDLEIENALEHICEFFQFDRCGLFKLARNSLTAELNGNHIDYNKSAEGKQHERLRRFKLLHFAARFPAHYQRRRDGIGTRFG